MSEHKHPDLNVMLARAVAQLLMADNCGTKEPCVNCLLGQLGNVVSMVLIEAVDKAEWNMALKDMNNQVNQSLNAKRLLDLKEGRLNG